MKKINTNTQKKKGPKQKQKRYFLCGENIKRCGGRGGIKKNVAWGGGGGIISINIKEQ